MNPQYPKFSRHISGAEYLKRKPDHRQGRHTNIDLKTLCHERGLSTKGTKRELKGRLRFEDRRPEKLRREAKLKALMEDKFKKTCSTEVEGLGLKLTKLQMKGRKRSSTYPPPGFKTTSPQRTAQGYTKLADLSINERGSGKSNEMEVERSPQVVLTKPLPLGNATPSVEDIVTRQFNRLQLHTSPTCEQDIESITNEIDRLPLPTISHCCKGTGETMSLDFSQLVRGDASTFTTENSEDEL